MPLVTSPDPKKKASEAAQLRAKAALVRKRKKTPLEDALAADGGNRAVQLVQWARTQKASYDSGLVLWRANRMKWSQEAQDIFDHRARARREKRELDTDGCTSIFDMSNDSVNIVAALAEFAAAQAEQDIYGGEPWFAANPVGKTDQKLADDIQHHIQWTFRDGRFVDAQCLGIDQAVTLGECFSKILYDVEVDESESKAFALHMDGKPVLDANSQYVTDEETAQGMGLKGKLEWKDAFQTKQNVIRQGIESLPLHYNDISFREDAPELDLRHTNVYISVEMSTFEAMRRFNLSKEDAIRLARCADVKQRTEQELQREQTADATTVVSVDDEPLGVEESDRLMNSRIRLIEAYIRGDALGNGKEARMCIVFPPMAEDWIIWADYLANISPNAELPIKCDVWEPVPHKLYGRGFFSKYAYLQTFTDDLWNQVGFRNAMHANPITAIREENMQIDEDGGDLVIGPGMTIKPKPSKTLADCLEFAQLPDADNRSMELFQIGMQLAQNRSGVTSASQGDLSAVPENNTATGVRALMSKAAVLLKKPIRRLRRSKGRAFSYAVKLYYANFDRTEAFAYGEGENKELVTITAENVQNLDIDVQMLMTQEQNQTKLQGAQVMMQQLQAYSAMPELDKVGARDGVIQALKALEFTNADMMVRQAAPTIQDCISILPPDQGALLQQLLLAAQQQQTATAATQSPPQTATTSAP